jgi:hypothetical protein
MDEHDAADRGLREKPADRIQRSASFLARSQEPASAYTTTVLGREFVVLPTVFSPHYYAETGTPKERSSIGRKPLSATRAP